MVKTTTIAPAPHQLQMNQQELVSERCYRFQKHIVLVDSNYRDRSKYPSPSSYRVELPSVYKQVKTVKLMSAEVPMSFYVFTSSKGFTTLHIGVYNASETTKLSLQTIQLPDGNYTNSTIVSTLKSLLDANALFQAQGLIFTVAIDPTTQIMSIETSPSRRVYIDTTSYTSNPKDTNWGLEYFLGFRKNTVAEGSPCKASNVIKLNPYNYILLDITEVNGMDECGRSTNTAFAKVPLNAKLFDTVMLSQDRCTYNTSYLNPYISKLGTLTVVWRTYDMNQIDFNDADHSFTLEIECLE